MRMYEALFLIIGVGLGWSFREIRILKQYVAKLAVVDRPRATPGPTMGVYHPPDENRQTGGIVTPKSPQLIEWEQLERTRQENLVQRSVKPR